MAFRFLFLMGLLSQLWSQGVPWEWSDRMSPVEYREYAVQKVAAMSDRPVPEVQNWLAKNPKHWVLVDQYMTQKHVYDKEQWNSGILTFGAVYAALTLGVMTIEPLGGVGMALAGTLYSIPAYGVYHSAQKNQIPQPTEIETCLRATLRDSTWSCNKPQVDVLEMNDDFVTDLMASEQWNGACARRIQIPSINPKAKKQSQQVALKLDDIGGGFLFDSSHKSQVMHLRRLLAERKGLDAYLNGLVQKSSDAELNLIMDRFLREPHIRSTWMDQRVQLNRKKALMTKGSQALYLGGALSTLGFLIFVNGEPAAMTIGGLMGLGGGILVREAFIKSKGTNNVDAEILRFHKWVRDTFNLYQSSPRSRLEDCSPTHQGSLNLETQVDPNAVVLPNSVSQTSINAKLQSEESRTFTHLKGGATCIWLPSESLKEALFFCEFPRALPFCEGQLAIKDDVCYPSYMESLPEPPPLEQYFRSPLDLSPGAIEGLGARP